MATTTRISTQDRLWSFETNPQAEDQIATGIAPQATALAAALSCPLTVARLLVARGMTNASIARRFFEPSLAELHSPLLMLGMKEAVERIQAAVASREPILIYGDYDVDGTTATVLLKTAIERIAPKEQPARVTYHVPHRIREGYGMQTNILGAAAAAGVKLVISVDTGIRAFEAAAEAKLLGLDLIVTDHHLPDDALGRPDALAVVNPAQAGCDYPFKSLCGAAVAFKLAHALLAAAALTAAEKHRLETVLLPSFLKLVAIATIADSVPLVDENRAIVALGLAALRNPVQPGLRALMAIAKIPFERAPTASEVGFRLAPRINAAGRMDIADDVVELFLTRDPAEAQRLAEKLDRLNEDRRASEARALEAIEAELAGLQAASDSGDYPRDCMVLDNASWHRGVIGILASRVVDRTGRPALVLSHENGQAHGSGRSIEGFHLLDALTAVNSGGLQTSAEVGPLGQQSSAAERLFSRFGGHAHAVGFSMPLSSVGELRQRMTAYAGPRLTGELLAKRLRCDLEIPLDEITPEFYQWIMQFAPFGMDNPEPVFVSRNVALAADPRIMQQRHLSLKLKRAETDELRAMAWGRGPALGEDQPWLAKSTAWALRAGSSVDLAYRLRWNSYGSQGTVELDLCDLKVLSTQ